MAKIGINTCHLPSFAGNVEQNTLFTL